MHKSTLYSSVIFFSFLTSIGIALYLQNVTHGRPYGAAIIGLWVVGWMYRRKYKKVFWYCTLQVIAYILLIPLYYTGVLPEFDASDDMQLRVALRVFCFGYPLIDHLATTSASVPLDLLPVWAFFLLSFVFLAFYFYYLSNLYENYAGAPKKENDVPDHFWEMALANLENNKDEGLWLRCYSEAGGSEEKTKANYLKYSARRFYSAEEGAREAKAKSNALSKLTSGVVSVIILGALLFFKVISGDVKFNEWLTKPIEFHVGMLIAAYPTIKDVELSSQFNNGEKISESISKEITSGGRYTISDDSLDMAISNDTVLSLKGVWGSVQACDSKKDENIQYVTMVFSKPIPPSRKAIVRGRLPFNNKKIFGDKKACVYLADFYAR